MKIFCFIIILSNVTFSFAQNWVPLDKGIYFAGNRYLYLDQEKNELYVHGVIITSGRGDTLRGIGKWSGSRFEALGNGVPYNPTCFAMARYKGKLYASGPWNPYNNSYLAIYQDDNNSWDTLSYSVQDMPWLNLVGDRLILTGWTDSCFGLPTTGICSYDGSNWSSLLTLADEGGGFHNIQSVVKYDNQLYIGGNFSLPDPTMEMIPDLAIIENNEVHSFGGGFQNGPMGAIIKLLVYKNELYIIGDFTKANGDAGNYIMRWDGQTLKDVGGGMDAYINDIIICNDYLVALGSFTYAGGVYSPKIAYWNGGQWNSLPGGEDFSASFSGIIEGQMYNNELYIVGYFETLAGDTFNNVAKYNHLLPAEENNFNIYMNNHGEEVVINYEAAHSYTLTIYISTVTGQQITSYSIENLQGYIHQVIPIPGLASGVYIVTAIAGDKKVSKKLLKLN
jgi:hypothetical protein